MKPRGLRDRLILLLAIGAAGVLLALTAGFNVLLRSSLDADADRVVRSRAESALETVAVGRNGSLRLLEAPAAQDADAGIWVYAGSRSLERPPAPKPLQELADSLAGRPGSFAESEPLDTRLFSLAVPRSRSPERGTIVAALSLEPYERTADRALAASVVFASLILVGVVAAGRVLVDRALRPVSRMTAEATEWSEHELDHRFGVGEPHDEITGLAAAFDSMLERLASSLRHEQRLSAEISHELRTPLAAIMGEVELALARERSPHEDRVALERIARRAAELERILQTLLAAARAELAAGRARCRVADVAAGALARAEPIAERFGVRASLRGGERNLEVDVEADLLERMLSPLIDNGCRHAVSRVEVRIDGDREDVIVTVSDDGPGVASAETGRIFEPGYRGAVDDGEPGAGLGLALARRLARSVGGELLAIASASARGGRFELRLPASPAAASPA